MKTKNNEERVLSSHEFGFLILSEKIGKLKVNILLSKNNIFEKMQKKEFWLKPIMCLIAPPAEAGGYSTENYNARYLFKFHSA